MGSIYGIVIPKRLKSALRSDNWIYALSKFRNKSDTLIDLRKRTKVALDEFTLLAEKMPRSELATALPPEKIVKLVHSYLREDPEEERLRLEMFDQSELLKSMQNLEEIREIMKKRETAFRQKVDPISRKRKVSIGEQAEIMITVEQEVWSEEDVLKLQWLAREQVNYWDLEGQYANHSRSVDPIRTKLAGDLALAGINYCSDQIGKVIEDVMAKRVRESLADAAELVTFIPAKVVNDSSNMKK